MAIDRYVIRYLPYDPDEDTDAMGVSLVNPESGPTPTALYPGNEGITTPTHFWRNYSMINLAALSAKPRVQQEFEFQLLGAGGAFVDPVDSIWIGGWALYSGGVIEVAAYIDDEYTIIGTFDMGNPYLLDTFNEQVALSIPAPDPQAFWTRLKQSIEII